MVKSGDTLYNIARRYSVTLDDIIYANQLDDPSVLAVGQALIIPQGQRIHVVQRGQTLFSIARRYDVTVQRIIAVNPSIDPNRIYPGQSIVIPAVGQDLGEIVVNGYITDATDDTLSAQLPYLTFLSPFSYRTDVTGALTQTFNMNTGTSEGERTANLLTITNLKAQGGFSSDIAHAILTDQAAQDDFLNNVEAKLSQGSWYGINIDFEYIYQFDRDSYNQFISRLTERLHTLGYIVVTALAPKLSDSQQGLLYTAHDYAFHGKTVDYVVLMTYEWGYTYGPAMAVAPIDKVRQVLDYAVSVMPSGKVLLGLPNYGYDWTLPFVQGSAAKPLTNVGAVTLAGQMGAAIQFDETAQSPFFLYTDGSGAQHEVWFEDARSLRAKYELVSEYGLAGVSFWNLNNLFRANFLVLESMFSVEKVI
ncbi:MAG: LysM peptidoglycan-binding domain-containing protein [Oscillospiraceae bacterium]|nr:LysM peptidoglycan-binding domain-containing protein [Oscillospiraceae bacterium]